MPSFCGKKMWTRSLKVLNHVPFVTQYFMLRPTSSQKCSARLARTDSTLIVSHNGSEVVARVHVCCASNHGAGPECRRSLTSRTLSATNQNVTSFQMKKIIGSIIRATYYLNM